MTCSSKTGSVIRVRRSRLWRYAFLLIAAVFAGSSICAVQVLTRGERAPRAASANDSQTGLASHGSADKSSRATSPLKEYHSVQQRTIPIYQFGNGCDLVLVLGGIHGDELGGISLAKELVRQLSKLPSSAFSKRVIVVPIANPDGYALHTRTNAHRIDINRSFPSKDFGTGAKSGSRYGGKRAGSEPETQAIMDVIRRHKPGLVISLHTPLGRVIYSGPSQEEAEMASRLTGFPCSYSIGYPMPGSAEDYFGKERGTKWLMIEVKRGTQQWHCCGRAMFTLLGVTGPEAESLLPAKRLGGNAIRPSVEDFRE